jgi:hypothetical protein
MTKQILVIFVLFAAIFSGCETRETGNIKDVTQSEIFQDLNFTSNGSGTKVSATLSFAGARGTTLKLTNPSKILFNEQPLEEKTGQYSGTYYEKDFNTVLSGGTFTFTDTKGKTYTNKVEMPMIDFKTSPTSINRSVITRLPILNGNKIAASNVSIEIDYENKEGFQKKTLSVFPNRQDANSAYFDEKTQSIVIEPTVWQDIKVSKIELQISATSSGKLQQGTTIGGKIFAEYIGKNINCNLVGKNVAITPKANANTKVKSVNANVMQNTNTLSNTTIIEKPLVKKGK